MFTEIERPTERPPALARVASDFGALYASNGFIGWLFAATAPVAGTAGPGVAPGGGRIMQCIANRAADLSPACKDVLVPFMAR